MIEFLLHHSIIARWREAMRMAALGLAAAAALLTGSPAAAQTPRLVACDREDPARTARTAGPTAPRLTGMPFDRAAAVLRGIEVTPRRIDVPSAAPGGQVVDEWPEPDEIIVGGVVLLCVSSGEQRPVIRTPILSARCWFGPGCVPRGQGIGISPRSERSTLELTGDLRPVAASRNADKHRDTDRPASLDRAPGVRGFDAGARRPDAGRGAGGVGGAADRDPSGDQARRASGAAGNCRRPVAASPNADKHRHRDRPASFDLAPLRRGFSCWCSSAGLWTRRGGRWRSGRSQTLPRSGAPSVRSRGGSSTANRRKPERR